MKFDIDNYDILTKILLGTNLKVVFKSRIDTSDKKVLELKDVAGFIDITNEQEQIKTLRLHEEGGSYNLDLSLRLQRPEVTNFPEVFIFFDKTCINFCFRAAARSIEFRNWTEDDKWFC